MSRCSKGYILRSGYYRQDGTYVSPSCVPDKGRPGKTPKSRKVLPKLKEGGLGKYGYSDVKATPAAVRRRALERGVRAEGYAPIVRRMTVLRTYTTRSDPRFAKILETDYLWLKKKYRPGDVSKTKRYNKRMTPARNSSPSKAKSPVALVKAGTYKGRDKTRQLYRVKGSTAKFYRYKGKDGSMKRRYV